MELDRPMEIGTRLRLELTLTPIATVIRAVGVVRWCRSSDSGYGLGIEFDGISKEDQKALDEAMDWQSKQSREDNEHLVLPFRREARECREANWQSKQSREDGECVIFSFCQKTQESEEAVTASDGGSNEKPDRVGVDRQTAAKGSPGILIKGLDGEEVEFKVSEAVFWSR